MSKRRAAHTWRDPKTGKLYALYTYTDAQGRRRYVYRQAQNLTHAKDLYRQMEAEFARAGERAFVAKTFAELCDYYEEYYLQPPQYRNGVKVSGLRSWRDGRSKLQVLRAWFGRTKLRDITHGMILSFKRERLARPTRRGGERAPASVHAELALLRRMLNVAVREGWLVANPFNMGEALISAAIECRRERVCSQEEEARLLAACSGPREHLRPIIICALDTGMRRGELLGLRWKDVDLVRGRILVRSFNSKTGRERELGMTDRMRDELSHLWSLSLRDPDDRVFGVSEIKRAFHTACRLAGITDLRFHDLRHTAATRLIAQGMPIEEVALVLGHAQISTTFRYTNRTPQTIERAARLLTELTRQHEDKIESIN